MDFRHQAIPVSGVSAFNADALLLVIAGNKLPADLPKPLTQAVEAIPASAWTHDLQPMPAGAVLSNRSVMITSDHRRGYDVDASRWLTAEESKKARGLSSE